MKKALALLLVWVLLLASCGAQAPVKSDAPATAASTTAAESTEPAASTTAAESTEPAASTLGPAPEIKIAIQKSSITKKMDDLPIYVKLQAEANVKIVWQEYSSDEWSAKKSLMFASGDLPDAFLGSTLVTSDIMSNVNYFRPLQDLLTNCPSLLTVMSDSSSFKAINTFPDGNMYTLSSRMPNRPLSFGHLFINQKWLTTVGLTMPTTMEEFITVLKAFRDNDPNGNGKQDEIPLVTAGLIGQLFGPEGFLGMFDAMNSIFNNLAIRDGKVEYSRVLSGYKEYVKFLHELYSEKLYDQEVATIDWTLYLNRITNPGNAIFGVSPGWSNDLISPDYKNDYVIIPPLKGPTGLQYWPYNNYEMPQVGLCKFAMTTKDTEPEATMRYIDLLYKPENSVQCYFGSAPECVTLESDGTYTVLPPTDSKQGYDNWVWVNGLGDGGALYVSPAEEQKVKMADDNPFKVKLVNDQIYQKYIKPDSVYPPALLERSLNDEAATIATDINKLGDEKIVAWVVNGGIDEEWDAYIGEMNNMGLQRYLEIYQKYYDDNYKK